MGADKNYWEITYGGTHYILPKGTDVDFYMLAPTSPAQLLCTLYPHSPRKIFVDNSGGQASSINYRINLPQVSTLSLGTRFTIDLAQPSGFLTALGIADYTGSIFLSLSYNPIFGQIVTLVASAGNLWYYTYWGSTSGSGFASG